MNAEQGNNAGGTQGSIPAEKVKVVGRIGQEPQYRTFPDQKNPGQEVLVGNFSIAEHPESQDRDVTVWHEVATFGERSRRLQQQFDAGELRVGQEVEVVGTLHRRERPTKDGGTRMVEQIYAYAVKPVAKDSKDSKESADAQAGNAVGPSQLQPPSWEPKE